jgi:hypothetical protein
MKKARIDAFRGPPAVRARRWPLRGFCDGIRLQARCDRMQERRDRSPQTVLLRAGVVKLANVDPGADRKFCDRTFVNDGPFANHLLRAT